MSPELKAELKDNYETKQRNKAFYIVNNDLLNKENPPDVSAVIGLDKELEAAFYAAKRPPLERPSLHMGIRVNRSTNKIIKEEKDKNIVKKKLTKKNGVHCPSLPTQWRNHFDIIIPKAEFLH